MTTASLHTYAPPPASGPGPLVPARGPAARLALAPALSCLPGTVRHVPEKIGAVLLASAVAAGVLAKPEDSAWGRLGARPPGCGVAPRPRRRAAPTTHLFTEMLMTTRDGIISGGGPVPCGGRARRVSVSEAIGMGAMPGSAIGVTGAAVLIGRPLGNGPVPKRSSVLVAVLMAAVPLDSAALVRVAAASSHETARRSHHRSQRRSQRAAGGGPAMPSRPSAHSGRDRFHRVPSPAMHR
jgi:hypothetical protein